MVLPDAAIGPYEIVEQIGAGGMATVFKARQARLDRNVAIKIMHEIFLSDDQFHARFEREARIVARLDHPNIVPVYDYDIHKGRPYLVMKYVEGRTLKNLLSQGALPLEDILRIMPAVASALTYAHSQGVLHRDVKPSNIIIDERGYPYLMDFGLARMAQAGESTMSADMILGTPHYISPEQAQGLTTLDSRTDVYSLGVVLYELVVGQVPYSGDTPFIIVHKHIYTAPPRPTEVDPSIPAAVEAVILKALSKDPNERYATPDALSAAFAQAVRDSNLTALDSSRATRVLPPQTVTPPPYGSQAVPAVEPVRKPATPPTLEPPGKVVGVPSPIPTGDRTSDVLDDIAARFREAVTDIRGQIIDSGGLNQMGKRAKDAFVEIRDSVEGAINEGGVGTSRGRRTRLIERDWSTEPGAVRRRVEERVKLRNGFIGHVATFIIVNAMIFASGGALSSFVSDIMISEGLVGVEALTAINIPLLIVLLWASGLAAHGLEVFSKTGRRWERRREAILTRMENSYGEDWLETVDDRDYRPVRDGINKAADRRMGLFQHAAVTFFLLFAIGPIAEPIREFLAANEAGMADFPVLPLLASIMLVSLVIHGMVLLGDGLFGDAARERGIERALARERQLSASASRSQRSEKAKNKAKRVDDSESPRVRLTEDGEFTESFIEELDSDPGRNQQR